MKVKEFIEKLQEFDGNMPIYIYDREDRKECDYFEFDKRVEGFSCNNQGKPIGSAVFKDKNEAVETAIKCKRRNPKYRDVLVIYADR